MLGVDWLMFWITLTRRNRIDLGMPVLDKNQLMGALLGFPMRRKSQLSDEMFRGAFTLLFETRSWINEYRGTPCVQKDRGIEGKFFAGIYSVLGSHPGWNYDYLHK